MLYIKILTLMIVFTIHSCCFCSVYPKGGYCCSPALIMIGCTEQNQTANLNYMLIINRIWW